MENLIVSLKFLGRLACLFALGHLIGHLLKLDLYYSDTQKVKNELKEENKKHIMKSMRNFFTSIFGIAFSIMLAFPAIAQENPLVSHFKVSADLVSSYVWRGSLSTAGPTPNIQPTVAYTNGNFEIGVWGSTDFQGTYKELDSYISYTAGLLKFTFTDYNWNFDKANYFNYSNSETGHRLEGSLGFTGSEKFPVSINWNTMFYGFDKNPDDNTKQAFSTYIELGYTRGIATVFFGFTPWTGLYNNYGVTAFDPEADKKSFSIVNIGTSVTKEVKITESFSLPVKATLIINPSASYSKGDFVSLVIGITI